MKPSRCDTLRRTLTHNWLSPSGFSRLKGWETTEGYVETGKIVTAPVAVFFVDGFSRLMSSGAEIFNVDLGTRRLSKIAPDCLDLKMSTLGTRDVTLNFASDSAIILNWLYPRHEFLFFVSFTQSDSNIAEIFFIQFLRSMRICFFGIFYFKMMVEF